MGFLWQRFCTDRGKDRFGRHVLIPFGSACTLRASKLADVAHASGQECPLHIVIAHQAENEVPQPHDFDAWGFTKTKPCCISVS